MLLPNKNVTSQMAQVHVKFNNSDNHELLHHYIYLKLNLEAFFGRLMELMKKRRLQAFKTNLNQVVEPQQVIDDKQQVLHMLVDEWEVSRMVVAEEELVKTSNSTVTDDTCGLEVSYMN
ncbi:hypothetical protein Tco_0904488 [Tanacetum coccineum]